MKTIVDYVFKFIQVIVMPVSLKFLDFFLKYFSEKYKKDENFKKQIDELRDKILSKINPAKLVQMYTESRAASAKREQEKKAEQKKAEAKKSPPEEPTKTSSEVSPDNDPDLMDEAAKTAKAGYKVAKKAAGVGVKKAGGLISRAGKWLREEVELGDDESESGGAPPENNPENEELDELKRRLADEQQTDTEPRPREPTPVKPSPKKPQTDDGDEESSDQKPKRSYSEELEEMLRKERANRDPHNH